MNKILTVAQLNNYVKNVFDDELLLQNITVEGEVFEAKYSGGNTYITLREGDYSLSCVKFGARFELTPGDKIHATGSMRFYVKGGKTTFVVTYVRPVGKGDLLAKLNELKDKLTKEGIFANDKKLPSFVKRLALVTSIEGAVIHDFLEVIQRNGCGYIDVDVYGVKVQGVGADQSIVKALAQCSNKEYDVIVVARGGGSGQDLSCFNAEGVARSVFGAAYPVISAIGHEVDYTLCDYAASIRAGTPSIAAELIARNNQAFVSRFYELTDRLKLMAEGLVTSAVIKAKSLSSDLMIGCQSKTMEIKSKVATYVNKMHLANGKILDDVIDGCRSGVTELSRQAQALFALREQELKYASAILDKTSPLKILSDGYAKVIKDGRSVDSADKVKVGDEIKVVMSGGALHCAVTDKE